MQILLDNKVSRSECILCTFATALFACNAEENGKIIKKAVATLAEKIKLFKAPKKKIPTFDFEEYNKMVEVNSRLQVVMAAIRKIDSKIGHKQELQKKIQRTSVSKFQSEAHKGVGRIVTSA